MRTTCLNKRNETTTGSRENFLDWNNLSNPFRKPPAVSYDQCLTRRTPNGEITSRIADVIETLCSKSFLESTCLVGALEILVFTAGDDFVKNIEVLTDTFREY